MTDRKQLGYKRGNIPDGVARVLGVKPKARSPLVDKARKVEVLNLIKVTRMIEKNNYNDIRGALNELKKGDSEDLEFVAENTSSLDVCMAILNGDYPGHIKKIADERIAKIGSEFDDVSAICGRIEKLEDKMKNGYIGVDDSANLLQANIELGEEIKKLSTRDLYELAAGSKSVHPCQTILSGEYPDDIKAIAECRLEQLEARKH